MKESKVEKKLIREVEKAGGWTPKFTSPGTNSMPDRIVMMPTGKMGFVETKRPGKKADPLQDYQHRRLRNLGFLVYVLDTDDTNNIRNIINEIRGL